MPPKKKNSMNPTTVDPECMKQLNLHYICGYCSKMMGDDKDERIAHAMSHYDKVTQCRTCILPIQLNEVDKHLKHIHSGQAQRINTYIDSSLIELRIPAGKSYSNFWGISLDSNDSILDHFSWYLKKWWENFKTARSLGCFRVSKSKIIWKCALCPAKQSIFNETIGMRAYALSHLETHHYNEIVTNVTGFFEFEWFQLKEETDFDIKTLMNLAKKRLAIKERSFFTFYTLNLLSLENGEQFLGKIQKFGVPGARYCLVCCCLVEKESLARHFRTESHAFLKAVPESTSFVCIAEKSEKDDGNEKIEENTEKFEFPRELFLYAKVFKNLRRDEFRWRCCLCPRAHAQTFATQIIMRMYALRHIDENHKFLFTEQFLSFEWRSIQHEMRASFDIRNYTPSDYTLKGEATFNNRDPNDYMLPQQYYFLTKEMIKDTVICGFCYRSLNHVDFLLHIVIHGFGVSSSQSCDLRPIVFNKSARDLMGQSSYNGNGLDDEPYQFLSVEGKRLKSKMELINRDQNSNRVEGYCTPSERETDVEAYTPSSRKSAMDARRVLSETFKVLQENARNRHDTWNTCSSSSSDEDDSEEEKFERNLDLEATTKLERSQRSKSRERTMNVLTMKPSEIREWIRREADKKGVEYNMESSDSESDSDDDHVEKSSNSGWRNLKPKKIKELIREAAKRKRVTLPNESSESSDED